MIDRLVCADGGNPDPTATHGKDAEQAKRMELAGWQYPKHLAGRVYGLVVHGDVAGIEGTRRGLSDWLDWMGLVDAGFQSRLHRYIGTTSLMRPAMTRSTPTTACRKRRATSPAPCSPPLQRRAPDGCSSPMRTWSARGRSEPRLYGAHAFR